jgi:septal ring factor EnvC (AmiA/AmiB activator)
MDCLRGFVLSGLILAAVACGDTSAFAKTNVKAQLAEKQAETAKLAEKSKTLQGEVDTLRTRLIATSKTMRATEDKISDTTQRLKSLQSDKAECLSNLYKDQQSLGGLVAAAERYNRTPTADLLVRTKPIDAARASLIMKSMIPTLHRQSDALKARIGEMARIEGQISAELAEQSDAYKTLSQQQADMGRLLRERQEIYQKNEKSRHTQEAEVTKLAQEAKNLADLVDKIKPKSKSVAALSLPANITLPVSGSIRTSFGDRDDYGSKSQGITFNAPSGATVVTPLAGTVKFAGSFQKYKQILIVEHAGGYHSLIAGLGRIDTVVGATLAAGEPVGIAEQSDAARIYYELRQDGEPVNPRKLLVASGKQAKS